VSTTYFPRSGVIPLWNTPAARTMLARVYSTKSSGTTIRNPWFTWYAARAGGFSLSWAEQKLLEITALDAVDEKPNQWAYQNARFALELAELFDIMPSAVTASADGGIALCFKVDGMYADIECFNSGEIWALTSDRINPATTWETKATPGSLGEALLRIKSALNA
jgi:hypothetical protein